MAGVELKDMPLEESTNHQKYGDNKDMLYSQFTRKAKSLLIVQGFQLQVKFAKFMTTLVVKNVLTAHDQHAGLEPEPKQSNKQALSGKP
jgi:hypothetical protein